MNEPRDPATQAPDAAPLAPLSPGLPVLGNTFQFLNDTSGLLVDSYRKLGPVFRLRALWLRYTVIAGFEAREFIREGLDDRYLSREVIFSEVGRQLGQADFVLGQSGEKHTRFRQLLSLAYSRQVASPFVPAFIEAVRHQVERWQPGTELPVMETVQRLAFEQYCQAMCGRSLGDYYRDCLMVTDYNMNVGGRVWPFFMYRAPWYRSARSRVLKLMWGMAQARRHAPPEGDQPATIMDTLLRVRDNQGEQLTDDEVVCYSMYGFAGSCSYMGRLVAFMLYEILQHPELHQQLTAEVDQAFAEGIRDATDVRKMRLLQAVYLETLRFHPVSQGMPFYAEKSFSYQGKRVSAGDTVVLSQVPMSFSKCPFHQPHTFDPNRCLEPRSEHRKEQAFHPFGIGHRTCTAMGLVELMAMTMVATLLHELRLTQQPADYRLKLSVKPLPAPDGNFRMRVEERRLAPTGERGLTAYAEEEVLAQFPGSDDPTVKEALTGAATRVHAPGSVILREGDEADAFHILLRGEVRVSRQREGVSEPLATLREGDYFGEMGLLQEIPRTATVTAGAAGAETLVLERADFLRVVAASDLISEDLARLVRKRIAAARLREALPEVSGMDLAHALPEFHPEEFEPGTVILRQGDLADRFFLILAGETAVQREAGAADEPELPTGQVALLGPGDYFGEAGLISGKPRNASVVARTLVSALVTDRVGFEHMLRETGGMRGDLARAMLTRARRLSEGGPASPAGKV